MSTTQQKVSELLSSTVVHTAVLNTVASRAYLKTLLSAAFATILRRRTTLDASLFRNHKFNEIDYNLFSVTSTSDIIKKFRCWTKGAFHVLKKNYLRHLYLVFSKVDNPSDVIESYKFKFEYNTDASTSTITREELDNMTTFFLESLSGLDMREVLDSDKYSPYVIITYCKDTPKDYQPPWHHKKKDLTASSILKNLPLDGKIFLDLGHIRTGFHSVKCRAQGKLIAPDEYDSSHRSTTTLNETAAESDEATESVAPKSVDLDCPCNLSQIYSSIDVIKCYNCKLLKHTPCVQFFSSISDNNYLCKKCKNSQALTPEEFIRQQESSIYRLAVAFAYFHHIVPFEVLNSAPPQCKSLVLQKLMTRKVVVYDGTKYQLDQNQLDIAALDVFGIHTDTNMICGPESSRLTNYEFNEDIILSGASKRRRLW